MWRNAVASYSVHYECPNGLQMYRRLPADVIGTGRIFVRCLCSRRLCRRRRHCVLSLPTWHILYYWQRLEPRHNRSLHSLPIWLVLTLRHRDDSYLHCVSCRNVLRYKRRGLPVKRMRWRVRCRLLRTDWWLCGRLRKRCGNLHAL